MSRRGDGVALHDDGRGIREVYVTGLFPGETGQIIIDHVSRKRPRVRGSLIKVLEPTPGRRPVPCRHHGQCTGCPLLDLDEPTQHAAKRVLVEQRYGIPFDRLEALPGGQLHYRQSSKRVVAGEPGRLILGSYVRGMHEVTTMRHCMVDHPDVVRTFAELTEVGDALGVFPYHEPTGLGDLRYVWARTDGRGNVLLTLVTAQGSSKGIEEVGRRLTIPVGIAWAVQPGLGNDMRGITVRPLRGRQTITVDIAGIHQTVGPLGFLQPNPSAAGLAILDLTRMPAGGVLRGQHALDLYAGSGVSTALLRRNFAEVTPCEAYPESARTLGIAPELAESFLAGLLAQPPALPIELVVANPPRGGLGPAVCDQLNRMAVPRLHLMSCSPKSLRDDLERLTGPEGSYRRIGARAYDTLPQTPHVEMVVWLVAKSLP